VRPIVLVVPGDVAAPTGGNVYDLALAEALRRDGTPVRVLPAPGAWPVGSVGDRAGLLRALLAGGEADAAAEGRRAIVLVDGLVGAGAPQAIRDAVTAGTDVWVLVHLPLALETGTNPRRAVQLDALEGAALHASSGVIATSRWAAADLERRHDLPSVDVAPPGVVPAELARGSNPLRIVHVAAVTPRKDQLGLVAALAEVAHLPWSAHLVGPLDRNPRYVEQVVDAIEVAGLSAKVQLRGDRTGAALEGEWAAADLAVLPSRAETYGMVVTEALARGLPVVVTSGTGAAEALGSAADGSLPGVLVPPAHPAALAAALRRWLTDPGHRRALARAARDRRSGLAGWEATAAAVRTAVDSR
jgi:glycosyltransferase involved in cell wall biosynthesis